MSYYRFPVNSWKKLLALIIIPVLVIGLFPIGVVAVPPPVSPFGGADLVITSASTIAAPGNPTWYSISFTVKNQGDSASIATDTSIVVDESELVNPVCPALAAGESVTIVAPWDQLGDVSGGTDTIEIIVDLSNLIPEDNETNNTATTSYSIFTIAASAGANGSISPSGNIIAGQGTDQSFNISANAGYHIAEVSIDGSPAAVVSTYTFQNIQAGHAIAASFAANAPSWDLNNDNKCDIGDVVVLGLHWAETGNPGWIPQDLNNDGVIDIGDVVILGLNWDETW
jgi:hypothetical protein